MWQELRTELHPLGLEIVTVALDINVELARKFIERSNAEHPALIDSAHSLDEKLGVVNVPSGVWIDEQGMIVRPPEPAWPGKSMTRELMRGLDLPTDGDPYIIQTLKTTSKIKVFPRVYLEALRDWVARGSESQFALAPDEVIARSRPRGLDAARAAAQFELGQYLVRAGHDADAVSHFREAHRLEPDNWTYKRQAWSLVNRMQAPSEEYDGDWAGDVEKQGPENYYPPFKP